MKPLKMAVFAIAIAALYLYGLDYIPLLAIDEPWYANTAHNIAHGLGLINTNAGERGGDVFCLYPLLLGLWFKLFPTTLWAARLFSVALLAPALFGLSKLTGTVSGHPTFSHPTPGPSPFPDGNRRGEPTFCLNAKFPSLFCKNGEGPGVGWLNIAVFALNPVIYLLFRRARPEALIVTLWIWALYCWQKSRETNHPGWTAVAWTLALLSVIAHPYALAGVITLGFLEIPRLKTVPNKLTHLASILLPGLLIPALFFLGLWLSNSLTPLDILHQLTHSDRGLNAQTDFIVQIGHNIQRFILDYTLNGKRALIAIIELALLIFAFQRTRHPLFAFGLLYLGLSLIIFHPLFRWGVGPVLIPVTLAWGFLFQKTTLLAPGSGSPGSAASGSTDPGCVKPKGKSEEKTVRRLSMGFLFKIILIIYVIAQTTSIGWLIMRHHHNTPYRNIETWVQNTVPKDSTVITQMELWFPLQTHPILTQTTRHPGRPTADYVLLAQATDQLSPTFGTARPPVTSTYTDYFITYSEATLGPPIATLNTHGYGTLKLWKFHR